MPKLLLFAATLLLGSAARLVAADDDTTLEQFLTRLGLTDLRALQLEERLTKQSAEAERQHLAQRLADLYAGQLVEFADDKTRYEGVLAKINRLVTQVPAAKTPSLEVMLLQADYYRAENAIGKWMADRGLTAQRDEAARILDRIAPELERLQQSLNEQYDKLNEALYLAEEVKPDDPRLQELQRLQPIVGRASYFAAWSNYYRGLARGSRESHQQARESFRRLLGLGDDYAGVEADSLGLESIWRARAMIGLALVEAALEDTTSSDRCFELLAQAKPPAEIRDQMAYWRLQSLLNVERYADAVPFAQAEIAAFTGVATQGQVSFCASMVQTAFAGSGPPPAALRELGVLGLGGLVKLGQRQTVKDLMAKYKIKPDAEAGFYLRWLHAQQLFEQAEKSKSADEYTAALAALQAALEHPDSAHDLGAAGQCRNQLAWCHYRLGQFAEAGREFQSASERLAAAKDKLAPEAAWMSFVAFQTAAKSEPRWLQSAVEVLNKMKREFPAHEYAQRADYYIGKLRQNVSPAENLRALQNVTPDSPDYLAARYDICNLLHEQWLKAAESERAGLARDLYAAVNTYLSAAGSKSDQERAARASLVAADVALASVPADAETATDFLSRASEFCRALPDSNATVAEYHFRLLQLAQQQNSLVRQRQHAGWLVAHASGSRYELPAVIVMAREADKVAQEDPSPQRLQEAYAQYARLVELLGDSPEAIRANKNAQVASSRLAHFAARLEKHDEAAARLEKLLAATEGPQDRGYLRRAGLSQFEAGHYPAAMEHWRTLLQGVSKGSDEWFEAKFYQLACLFQIDRARGRTAFDQFKLLYPELGPPAWRDRFAKLAAEYNAKAE